MTLTAWLSLFAISLLGAMSPGPSLAVVTKNTLNGDKLNGILTAWSHALGIGFYAIFTMFGLAILLQNNPFVFKIISYLGAGYLIYLGINAIRAKSSFSNTSSKQKNSYIQSMRDGIMISILNPKIGLFFIALFSQYIHKDVGTSGQIITVLTPLLTDGTWYTLITLIISTPKILETLKQKADIINKITGVILILLAIKILFV